MFCPKCGRINPDENEVCKGCGAALHNEEEKAVQKSKGSLAKKLIILLFAVVVVCVIVFIGFRN